jgi:hypothetical protein
MLAKLTAWWRGGGERLVVGAAVSAAIGFMLAAVPVAFAVLLAAALGRPQAVLLLWGAAVLWLVFRWGPPEAPEGREWEFAAVRLPAAALGFLIGFNSLVPHLPDWASRLAEIFS